MSKSTPRLLAAALIAVLALSACTSDEDPNEETGKTLEELVEDGEVIIAGPTTTVAMSAPSTTAAPETVTTTSVEGTLPGAPEYEGSYGYPFCADVLTFGIPTDYTGCYDPLADSIVVGGTVDWSPDCRITTLVYDGTTYVGPLGGTFSIGDTADQSLCV